MTITTKTTASNLIKATLVAAIISSTVPASAYANCDGGSVCGEMTRELQKDNEKRWNANRNNQRRSNKSDGLSIGEKLFIGLLGAIVVCTVSEKCGPNKN